MNHSIAHPARLSRFCTIALSSFCALSLLGYAHAQEPTPSPIPPPPEKSKTEPKTVTTKKVPSAETSQPIDLSKFPQGWVQYTTDKKIALNQIWKVSPGDENTGDVLICAGEPHGYLRTQKKYQNFEFSLEWKFPKDPNGNSGVLIHTGDEDKIWPNSIQVQLHGASTGSIFPLGEAMSANNLQVRDLTLSPLQWNKLTIKSLSGRITVSVNDRLLGEITGCTPTAGSISLQSEGAEIHFRKIRIRELPVVETTTVTGDGRTVIIRKKKDDDDDGDS
ncbi:MAG: DUF1080 domain-containing protein [Planctomycetaceae bacterium]|nr:DUF1080 domain-containing protein [Planctomycetaceae bacterium]